MSTLRIYDPVDCDAAGDLLDWERCRMCGGSGYEDAMTNSPAFDPSRCPACRGRRSLKAAVLAELRLLHPAVLGTGDGWSTRCESCSHPMSEGTWEGDTRGIGEQGRNDRALAALRIGGEPDDAYGVHYSACDSLCYHGGPGRAATAAGWRPFVPEHAGAALAKMRDDYSGAVVEASWRSVEVRRGMIAKRTLGDRFDPSNVLHVRPWDLRRENVAVLCLRCFAAPDL